MSEEDSSPDRQGLLSQKTLQQYNAVRRQFFRCVGIEDVAGDTFVLLAKFITEVGERNDYKV
jgi:hypothetical protein